MFHMTRNNSGQSVQRLQQQPREYLSHLQPRAIESERWLEEIGLKAGIEANKVWKSTPVLFQPRIKVCGIGVEGLINLSMRAPSAVAYGKDGVAVYRCGGQCHSQQ